MKVGEAETEAEKIGAETGHLERDTGHEAKIQSGPVGPVQRIHELDCFGRQLIRSVARNEKPWAAQREWKFGRAEKPCRK
jgi:hypothetical protein